jgi:opacity protein-like surface antigen
MNTRLVITAAVGAASHAFEVTTNNPITVIGHGWNDGADIIPIEISYDDGDNFEACGKDGIAIKLSKLNNPVTIFGAGMYRVNKGITSEAVGVSLATEQG